jgi:hypothetical protein
VPDAAKSGVPLEYRDVVIAGSTQHDRCANTPAHHGDRETARRAAAPVTASVRAHTTEATFSTGRVGRNGDGPPDAARGATGLRCSFGGKAAVRPALLPSMYLGTPASGRPTGRRAAA